MGVSGTMTVFGTWAATLSLTTEAKWGCCPHLTISEQSERAFRSLREGRDSG